MGGFCLEKELILTWKATRKAKFIVGACIAFIFSLVHPITRPIVWFILPFGSSPDDLIVIALLVLFVFTWKGIKIK